MADTPGLARLFVDNADTTQLSAEVQLGSAEERRSDGFTFYSLFHGGVDAPRQAWEPLHCPCVGGCDSQPEARILFHEGTGLESSVNFFQLKPHDVPDHEVLVSGSPCQAFSPLGALLGLDDVRGRLYIKQLDLVAASAPLKRPLIILLEQVPNVLHVADGKAQRLLLRRARNLGYVARQQLIDSSDFGSASRRVRLFTTLVREDVVKAVGLPAPPARPPGRRRVVNDVIKPLQTRPLEHVLSRTGWRGARVQTRADYHGPVVVGLGPGPAPGNHAYSTEFPAPTQRATGRYPTGVYYQEGALVTLTARESARCMDIDDSVDIGERWGETLAQQFVGNSMSVFVMRAFGESFKPVVAAWRALGRHPTHKVTPLAEGDDPHEEVGADGAKAPHCPVERHHLPEAPDFLRRHQDHCPIWCFNAKCTVCNSFSWKAGRKLAHYAWLRKLRDEWPAIRDFNRNRVKPVSERVLRKDFFDTVRLWHARMYDLDAGTRLIWWHWPHHMWDEIREGVELGFQSEPDSGFRPNHPTGEHRDVGQELDRFHRCGFVERGHIASQSPLAYVPKRAAGIGRVIYDMKRSRVNELLFRMPVSYPRINDVMRKLYPDAWFFETDFIDHFYHFRVRPADRKHLGIRRPHGAGYYRFTTLPMGCATSPYHCSRLTYAWDDALAKLPPYRGAHKLNLPGLPGYDPSAPYMYKVDGDGHACPTDSIYVDDVHGVGPTHDKAMAALKSLMISAGSHGFGMKYKKVRGPAQFDRAFNGFTMDSRPEFGGPKINPGNEKRDEALAMLEALRLVRQPGGGRSLVGRRRLAQIVGLLQSLVPGVPHGNTFLRRLYDSVHCLHLPHDERPGTDYDVPVSLDAEHWKDVDWWITVLKLNDGARLLCNRDVRTRAHFTDGSGRGTGGTAQRFDSEPLPRISFFSGTWKKSVVSMTSNWKELKSILIALRRERLAAERERRPSSLRRARIYHMTDNMVSESVLARGTSTAPRLQQLLREIAYELVMQQCELLPVHVAGARLIAQGTDGLSRGQTAVGALSGATTDVRNFNPLHGSLPRLSPGLEAWARDKFGSQPFLRHPDSWTAAAVVGRDTLWYPHPLLARSALQAFLRHRMQAPRTTAATFLLPRRFTADWGRLLRHFSLELVRAGAGPHWPASEFETLIVARCEPWELTLPSPPHPPLYRQVGSTQHQARASLRRRLFLGKAAAGRA